MFTKRSPVRVITAIVLAMGLLTHTASAGDVLSTLHRWLGYATVALSAGTDIKW